MNVRVTLCLALIALVAVVPEAAADGTSSTTEASATSTDSGSYSTQSDSFSADFSGPGPGCRPTC